MALNEFYNKEYKKSYDYLLKAKELVTDNYQNIEVMIGIGATLESLGEIDDSINICNETIDQYKNSNDDIIIAWADPIRTPSRFALGHSAGVDSDSQPIYTRTIL